MPKDGLTTWVELNTDSCKESHIFSVVTISTNSRGTGIGQQSEGSDISQARSSQTGLKGTGDTCLVAFQTPRESDRCLLTVPQILREQKQHTVSNPPSFYLRDIATRKLLNDDLHNFNCSSVLLGLYRQRRWIGGTCRKYGEDEK